jgi:hypothetical protein
MADVIAFLSPDTRYISVEDGGVSGNFLWRLPGVAQIPRE